MNKRLALFSLCAMFAVASSAHAGPISIFNTGTSAEGTADPFYTLLSGPTCPAGSCPAFVTVTDGYPITPGGWPANGPTSSWIQPVSGTTDDFVGGVYVYRTTFDLTGFNPATATIAGQWMTDNQGLDILINGVSTGQTSCCQWFFYTPFLISGGFLPGVNTLDFVVNNEIVTFPGNVTGLRVEILRAEAVAVVPEPASLGLLGVGLVAAAWRLRRSRRKV